MIPAIQNDYFKYMNMFRGSSYKGASTAKGLLANPFIGPVLANTPAAVSALFTDASRSDMDALCCDALATTDYYDTALNTFLANTGKSDTCLGVMNDTTKMLAYERNVAYNIPFEKCPKYSAKMATRRQNIAALMIATNADVLSRNNVRNMVIAARKSVANTINIDAAITSWASTNGTYGVPNRYGKVYVSKFNCILIGVQLTTGGNSYAGVLRYNVATGLVTLCMISSYGETSSTIAAKQWYDSCIKPAYDATTDSVYSFYCSYANVIVYYDCGTLTASETQLTYTARAKVCMGFESSNRDYAPTGYTIQVWADAGKASFAFGYSSSTAYVVNVTSTAYVSNAYLCNLTGNSYSSYSTLHTSPTPYTVYMSGDYILHIQLYAWNGSTIVMAETTVSQGSGSTSQSFYASYSPCPGVLLITSYYGYNNSGTWSYWGHRVTVVTNNTYRETMAVSATQPISITYLYYDTYTDTLLFGVGGTDYMYRSNVRITDTTYISAVLQVMKNITDYIYQSVTSVEAWVDKLTGTDMCIKKTTGCNLGTVLVDTIAA